MADCDTETPQITPAMVEAGVDALFASGLVEWNRPRSAVRAAVEEILWAAHKPHELASPQSSVVPNDVANAVTSST